MKTIRLIIISLFMAAALTVNAGMTITTPRDGDLYYSGETVTFSIASDLPNGSVRAYQLKKDGLPIVSSGNITVNSSGAATVTYVPTNQCFLNLFVDYNNNGIANDDPQCGAACEPWKLIPENAPPADFASFWNGKKAALDALPPNAVVTYLPAESDAEIDVYSYELNAGGGTIGTAAGVKAYGYFAKPKGPGPFPAIIEFYGAGSFSVGPGETKVWARRGALSFNMNPHPLMNGQDAAYYNSYITNALSGYNLYGRTSRETSYFLGMYSRCYVATRYLTSLAEWDNEHLVIQGFSQGGGQTIATSYLIPETTAFVAVCPALNDHGARVYNRQVGWPFWVAYSGNTPNAGMLTASKYYDGVNFSALINSSVHGYYTAGFIDSTCVPGTVYTAFNAFLGRKEILNMLGVDHSQSDPLYVNDRNTFIAEELGLDYQSVHEQLWIDCMENNPVDVNRWKSVNCSVAGSANAYEGLSSLKITCQAATGSEAVLVKNLDLTDYADNGGVLEYVIKGDPANPVNWGAVKVGFVSASGGTLVQSNQITVGQSASWALVTQPLADFQSTGSPEWNDITSIRIYDGDSRAGTFLVDKVRVFVKNAGATNTAPVISPAAVTNARVNVAYSYTVQASDVDGDFLIYSSSLIPSWLSFDPDTRILSGTPVSANIGSHAVTLSVSDGTTNTLQSFNIQVSDNLVLNGSFEAGISSWNPNGSAVVTNGAAQDGTSYLTFLADGVNPPTTQTIPIMPNTVYDLSVWIKRGASAIGGVVFDTNDRFEGPPNNCQFVVYAGQATSWTHYSSSFESGSFTDVTLRIFTDDPSSTGPNYFDNISLTARGRPDGLVDRTDEAGAIMTSQYNNSPAGSGPAQLFDNDVNTKYLTTNSSSWVQHQFADHKKYTVQWYTVTSAMDAPTVLSSNLVLNGSFEAGGTAPDNWPVGGAGTRIIGTAQDGSASLRVTTHVFGATTQSIPIEIGKTYYLSAWMNTVGLTVGNVVFDTDDKYDNAPDSCQFEIGSNNGGWTQYSGSFTATTTPLILRCFTTPLFAGTAYYDNISLTTVTAGQPDPMDPASWTLSGSNDGSNWAVVDSRSGVDFTSRGQTFEFDALDNSTAYEYYRLTATNGSGSILQYAEVELFGPSAESLTDPYNTIWTTAVPGVDPNTALADDYDGDGRNNLYEYALNGDPENSLDFGADPLLVKTDGIFKYTHLKRSDDPDLIYRVETCTDLIAGVWTNTGSSVLGTTVTGGAYDEVVNTISTTNSRSYIRLKITNP